mmetsp:Transcript_13337/g.35788  ORF Transcript_13337/g.35788 Transcript_13337/m.35788 type:complete len:245 (-) Transcript_13337:130-864(-)
MPLRGATRLRARAASGDARRPGAVLCWACAVLCAIVTLRSRASPSFGLRGAPLGGVPWRPTPSTSSAISARAFNTNGYLVTDGEEKEEPEAESAMVDGSGADRRRLEDLVIGELVSGVVNNSNTYGVFFDIGAEKDAKLNVSRWAAKRLTKNQTVEGLRIEHVDVEKGHVTASIDEEALTAIVGKPQPQPQPTGKKKKKKAKKAKKAVADAGSRKPAIELSVTGGLRVVNVDTKSGRIVLALGS